MIIVFGGSFNPPTNAHEKIVEVLISKYPTSKIIILPTGNKYDKKELIDFKHRYKMLKLVFSSKQVKISKLERKKSFQGTINALDQFDRKNKNVFFVMGTDNLQKIDLWIESKRLIEQYPFIIFKRNNDDVSKMLDKHPNINKRHQVINFDEQISSSEIRQDVLKNKNNLNEKVYNYILKNNLYEVK